MNSRHRHHSDGKRRPSRSTESLLNILGALLLAAAVLLPGPIVQLLKGMP